MTEQQALVWEGGNVVAVRPVAVPESSGLGGSRRRVRGDLRQRPAHRSR